MPRPVLDPEQLVRRRPAPGPPLRLAAAVLLALVALVALAAGMQGPSFVDELTVVNESPFDVHVVVRSPGGPELSLGTVPRDRELRFDAVLDQGATWAFGFSSGSEDGGVLEVRREALEQGGWRLDVPATTTARLEQAGLAPAPSFRRAG